MRLKNTFLLFGCLWAAPLLGAGTAFRDTLGTQVVPIDWTGFKDRIKNSTDLQQSRKILANAVRYNLAWIPRTFQADDSTGNYVLTHYDENGIRPSASVIYGAAVALQCAGMDEKELGISRQEAFRRISRLAGGVAAAYKANRRNATGWGKGWQTAFWATLAGEGAWMIWDHLTPETRKMVQRMVVGEADRFIAPGYHVPYWKNPDGHVNTPGDTKAEENAWNANILQLAVAMMPHHLHIVKWKEVGSELMISAFSMKKDLGSNRKIDGKRVRDWLHGYNVRDDGAVINHRIVHPDYTMTITLNSRAYLTQSLGREPVSEGAALNSAFIYGALVTHVWPSPPYKEPGGTIYIPGKAEVYYPQGTDWSKYRFDIYYLNDVNADILGWDKGLKHKAHEWMEIRARRILSMQARHADGHMFTHEEYPTYPGCEQMVAWQAGDAYLLLWLQAKGALSGIKRSGRHWLSKRQIARSVRKAKGPASKSF